MFHKIIRRLAILASLFLILWGAWSIEKGHITHERVDRSAVQIKKKTSVLFFYRDNCPDCKHVFPLVSVLKDLGSPIQFINVNNRMNHSKARQVYHVKAVPTFILINKQRKVLSSYTGSDLRSIKKFITQKIPKVGD
ncbi:hypothetical protein JF75_05510 [Lactobacillus kimbladii]|uniref:Thioredoxin domain-containing protein n=1 Tax=Lactobacillus kimbladii TaxID=1218506 RepID=A0A0F4LNE0_9LACO|nr:thioredoxin family protein [Lactobacillus kimbladii]KJY59091.1 hypothetical protein JF75_05510 [Lactobacillus kimbladii]